MVAGNLVLTNTLLPEGGILEGEDLVEVAELGAAVAVARLDGAHDLEELAVGDGTVLVVIDLLNAIRKEYAEKRKERIKRTAIDSSA